MSPTMVFLVSRNVISCQRDLTLGPIPPGGSFTYTFQATSYGHTWYHSHFSLQYSNGLTGSLVIYGPSSANWDIDLGVLPIMDWYHESAFTAYYQERQAPLAADNALFNGLNTFDEGGNTAGSKYEMTFQPGKKHRIRLVNMSTDSHFKFSIDEHTLTVMAADFVPIEPYTTDVLNIFIGIPLDCNSNHRSALRSRSGSRPSCGQLLDAIDCHRRLL
jgi:FtsP/CotA-like multicopper oxidase with cupredoxin domain